jgi:hypothetical protein
MEQLWALSTLQANPRNGGSPLLPLSLLQKALGYGENLDMTYATNPNRKIMKSLIMLVTWTIWKERNARVFNNKAPTTILLAVIKREVKLWVAAGAKHLSFLMTGE